MRSTFRVFCYIDRQKVRADGTTAVWCRLSIDGKRAVLTTGLYCRPEMWDPRRGEILSPRENNHLEAFRQRVVRTYEQMLEEQGVVSAAMLKERLVGRHPVPTTLLATGEAELERLARRAERIGSTSTWRESRLMQGNLRRFLQSRGEEDFPLRDLTEAFGQAFKLYLKSSQQRSPSYVNRSLTWLNRLAYIAIDREILRCNPLEDLPYEKKVPPRHRAISREDLQRLLTHPQADPRLELIRRMFLFSCLTGLAYADMQSLYPRHIGQTAEGRSYIRKQRVKTRFEAFILLHPIAERILSLYNRTDDTQPVFPLGPRDGIWHDIHQLGIIVGIRENLSYHQGRHSFGTLAISAGLSIESIAKMMGHANISTTQGYAQITEQKISEDMDRLIRRRARRQDESPAKV